MSMDLCSRRNDHQDSNTELLKCNKIRRNPFIKIHKLGFGTQVEPHFSEYIWNTDPSSSLGNAFGHTVFIAILMVG